MNEQRTLSGPDPYPWRVMGVRLAGVIGLSAVLGLAFNAANPLGVRWTEHAPLTTRPGEGAGTVASRRTSSEPAAPTGAAPTTSPAASTEVNEPIATLPAPSPPTPEAPFRPPAPVTWAETRPLVEGGEVVLVDARSKAVFEAGHIPGAVLLAEGSTAQELAAFRDGYGTNRYVVVYCSSTSCSVSFKLAYKLAKDYGFAKVDYMTGGYFEYQREHGLALEPATPSTEAASAGSFPVASAPLPVSWTKAAPWLQSGEAILVDARPATEFAAGHLPGAVSLPVDSDAAQLTAFAEGVGTNSTVVVYGASIGSLATLDHAARLARELPLRGVRFLPDGYRELAAAGASATNVTSAP